MTKKKAVTNRLKQRVCKKTAGKGGSAQRAMKPGSKLAAKTPAGYAPLLADLKARVRSAQLRAAASVNQELILLYWHIGRGILRSQQEQGWGRANAHFG